MQRSLFLLFYLSNTVCFAQIEAKIFIDNVEAFDVQFKDSLALHRYIEKLSLEEVKNGYLFAGVDSIVTANSHAAVYFHRGKMLGKQSIRQSKKLLTVVEKRLADLSDNGYPFAQVRVDSARVASESFSWSLLESRGPLIENDSIVFLSEIKTKSSFVSNLIDHVPNRPFNESNYTSLARKVDRVDFLELNRPPDIGFQANKAVLYLDLTEETSSSFEGIVGLQQNQQQGSDFVGNFNLDLQNLFRSGKELMLNWQSFDQGSQELQLAYKHPFIFNSKINPSFAFSLLRQDSLFLQRETHINIASYISSTTELTFAFNRQIGSLTTTEEVTLNGQDFADYESTNYFIQIGRNRTNTAQLSNSTYWRSRIGTGRKSIQQNPGLDDSFYDTLQLESTNFLFDFEGGLSQKVGRLTTVNQEVSFRLIENDELLNNERFRIGGLNSIRGFNEKFFFADRYLLSRTEFRAFFERGSYLFTFFDQLFYQNDRFRDYAFGTGLGFSLKTSGGRFNFAFALGKSEQQPLDPSNIKVHFGYTAKF